MTTASSPFPADFLLCGLCSQPYTAPKSLSCLHSFCTCCLETHVARSSRSNGAHGKTGGLFCPTCTQVTDLPKSGVKGLKDNRLLTTLLDMVSSRCCHNCDLCSADGVANAATYCCVKCEDFLCDDCARTHKRERITRDHSVANVGSLVDIVRKLQGKGESSKINARLLSKFGRHSDVMHYPISICVNKAGDIVVANDNHKVSIFSLSGNCKKVMDQNSFYGKEENVLPAKCVAITPEGYVAVAMRKDYTPQLVHMGVIQSLAGREISILTGRVKNPADVQPHGITVTPNNHIIITDVGKNCVYVFDADLQMVRVFGKKGSRGRRQFKGPYFVSSTPNSDIVVSDYGNHCVKIFDLKGKPKLVIGKLGRGEGELMHPMGVCVDRYGNVFVADRDNHRVQMFDAQGRYLATIITFSCKDGQDVRPQDVAMTMFGHLAVLVRGIEGVDIAEIHVYQYGSSKQATEDFQQFQYKTTDDKNGIVHPRRLPPMSESARREPAPDILPKGSLKGTKAEKYQQAEAEALAALYATATGQKVPSNRDHASQICVLL